MNYFNPRNELSLEEQQTRKKRIVYSAMFAVFAVVMWFIFKPSADEQEQKPFHSAFITDLPMATTKPLYDDKITAYEQAKYEEDDEERARQVQELASMLSNQVDQYEDYEPNSEKKKRLSKLKKSESVSGETTDASLRAYKNINKTLDNFYEKPKSDSKKEVAKKEEISKEVEKSQDSIENIETQKAVVAEQKALMEKSYELASKYMQTGRIGEQNTEPKPEPVKDNRNRKNVCSAQRVVHSVVSMLYQKPKDSISSDTIKERNVGFITPVGAEEIPDKNTIKACIDRNQTIMDGQGVRIRVLEDMRVGKYIIPRNTTITGISRMRGDRLYIEIVSLEHAQSIIHVELTVYDYDGQKGIYIPDSDEIRAAKEIIANMGNNLGTSVSITNQSASDQILAELGKGTIKGLSKYISKQMEKMKVHLKEGYIIMLYNEIN